MVRRALVLTALSLLSVTVVWGQLPANELEGTWEMVSQQLVYADSVVDRTGQIPRTTKTLNSTHFAFGRQIQDEAIYAGGGRYTYEDGRYTEHIEWHSAAGLAGQSITFDARVEDDTWFHSGDIGDFRLEEVWSRVSDGTSQASR